MVLKDYTHNPCVYTWYLIPGGAKIYIGLYVDDFVYFSESDAVEETFRTSPSSMIQVYRQGYMDWFLKTSF